MSSGTITKSSSTVGSSTTPVYLNSGTITSTGIDIQSIKDSIDSIGINATEIDYTKYSSNADTLTASVSTGQMIIFTWDGYGFWALIVSENSLAGIKSTGSSSASAVFFSGSSIIDSNGIYETTLSNGTLNILRKNSSVNNGHLYIISF